MLAMPIQCMPWNPSIVVTPQDLTFFSLTHFLMDQVGGYPGKYSRDIAISQSLANAEMQL